MQGTLVSLGFIQPAYSPEHIDQNKQSGKAEPFF
jgi:hypothetical protein